MGKDIGRVAVGETGSREPSPAVSALSGFDPARMEKRLNELLALEPNWNSYRARPIDPACAERVRRFYPVMEILGLAPWITPDPNGGLSLERAGVDDYTVDIEPDGKASVCFIDLSDDEAWALVGLFAQLKGLTAIATEARRAATTGAVHEGADPKGIAQ